jgi:hypothetical protein
MLQLQQHHKKLQFAISGDAEAVVVWDLERLSLSKLIWFLWT